MKRCPECGREYDNSMMFCLDVGAELLYGPASGQGPVRTRISDAQFDKDRTVVMSNPGIAASACANDEPPTAIVRAQGVGNAIMITDFR